MSNGLSALPLPRQSYRGSIELVPVGCPVAIVASLLGRPQQAGGLQAGLTTAASKLLLQACSHTVLVAAAAEPPVGVAAAVWPYGT